MYVFIFGAMKQEINSIFNEIEDEIEDEFHLQFHCTYKFAESFLSREFWFAVPPCFNTKIVITYTK